VLFYNVLWRLLGVWCRFITLKQICLSWYEYLTETSTDFTWHFGNAISTFQSRMENICHSVAVKFRC